MRKSIFTKVAAVALTLALALVIVGLPGTAQAAVTGVTISTSGGASYSIPVGGTVTLNAVDTGTPDGTMSYSWGVSPGGTNVSLSSPTGASTIVTGVNPGTTATVNLTATDSATGTPYTASAVITVLDMTISNTSLTLDGGSSQTLTVGNVPAGSTTTWTSSRDAVATVSAAGLVTAVGGGSATITAANSNGLSKTCAVTVNPIITITPLTQNITAASTSGSIQLRVDYGGDLIGTSSSVTWSNSNAVAGSLTLAPTAFTDHTTYLTCTASFLSNSTGVNATTYVTATINGASTYTSSKTATVNVRTARYLTIEGDTALSNTDRYGNYIVTLHEANGSVVDDDTSTVHWSWSSSYLKISSADLNDYRADMENGTAEIQLYARYNTPTAGTKLYAWINSDTAGKVNTTIHITGLSALPQTGQDFTLAYVLGSLCAALLIAAGVWYGIRKKRVTNA